MEPRAPLETEVSTIIGFLDEQLRPGNEWSIAAEYPHVFSKSNLGNIRIISDNQKVLAHAAVKYLLIKNIFGIFKVAAIGSVVTDPGHRNQGLSQKLITSCLEMAQQEGADFAVLWTDLYDFYRKLGFELAGSETSVVIDTTPPLAQVITHEISDIKFMQSAKVSPDAILRLYSQHTCGTLRTNDDIRKYLLIPNSRMYTAWNSKNELLAYAVEGKGMDLKGYIHEWGGGVSALLALIAHIRKEQNAVVTLIAPQHSQNLIRHLDEWATLKHSGFLGMIRPVHFENLFFKVRRAARNLGIQNFVLEKREDHFVIGTKDDLAKINTIGELTRLLFGPIDEEQLKPEFQKLLPIPMWIWGWDSV